MDGIVIRRLYNDMVEMICPRRVEAEHLAKAARDVAKLCEEHTGIKVLVVDATDMIEFAFDISAPAHAFVSALKRNGVKSGGAATKSTAVRMLGSTIALAAGFKLRFFETRNQAIAHAFSLLNLK